MNKVLILGAGLVVIAGAVLPDATAFGATFGLEAGLLVIAAVIAMKVLQTIPDRRQMPSGLAISGE